MQTPASPSTAPSQPAKPARKPRLKAGGRGKGFVPTKEQRTLVEGMAAYGIPHVEIAALIINPETQSHISAITLREHFREELDTGHTKANAKVIGAMFKNATTGTKAFPGGIPVSQIFWAKVRMQWRTADKQGEAPPPPANPAEKMTALEVVRRIAFLLYRPPGAARAPVTIEQPKT